MSNLRRLEDPRTLYFITCVTERRTKILNENSRLLWESIHAVSERTQFNLQAWVFLPDHFHLLLDVGEFTISNLLQRIKMSFAAKYRKQEGMSAGQVWQHRFWDHIIRDQDDLNRHIDYIHYNPVKHGYVDSPFKWVDTSIHRCANRGVYAADWGEKPPRIPGDFGE